MLMWQDKLTSYDQFTNFQLWSSFIFNHTAYYSVIKTSEIQMISIIHSTLFCVFSIVFRSYSDWVLHSYCSDNITQFLSDVNFMIGLWKSKTAIEPVIN